jgi:alpha-N-arabinofuranosidase
MMRLLAIGAALVVVATGLPARAAPAARFAELAYEGVVAAPESPGTYRNPILPGFHPDPSVVRVGEDFYLVTSTFGWFPGIPVFHSRDLVNWRLIGHAIDRPGQLDLAGLKVVTQGVYAPAITYHAGKFYIFNTCVGCGDNFYVTATDPAGPWSDPVWLGFDGIDPSLFVDDDGRGWLVNNGPPVGTPRYEGHRAIWIQQFDLAAGKLVGPRSVLVDGGVHPEDKPIWAEGPHIFKKDGWYYLNAAEGGTAEDHSQTIYRSRDVAGPYTAGPINPILTQRDLSLDRPDRVEATGHADLVRLDDGNWWAVFLATRPFAGQKTLLGRETWLLPVTWQDGWPLILEQGRPVPWEQPRPNLPADQPADWSKWTDSFDAASLSPEWLQMRNPASMQWFAVDRDRGELVVIGGDDSASTSGSPHFLGRRMRSPAAQWTTRFAFQPEREGDLAGLMAFIDEANFLVAGIEQGPAGRRLVVRRRAGEGGAANGELAAETPLPASTGEVDLRLAIADGTAALDWRPAGAGAWRCLARSIDVSHMASVNAGLFTGTMVGPYAVRGPQAP